MTGKFTVNQLSAPHGKCHWRVEGKIHGKRIRAFYPTKLEAEEAARRQNIELADHGAKSAAFPEWLRSEALYCHQLLERIGANLTQATDFYLKHHDRRANSLTVNEAFKAFQTHTERRVANDLITKGHAGTSNKSIRKFAAEFGERFICDITTLQIQDWLDLLPLAAPTKRTLRRNIGALFIYARKRTWIKENPVKEVEAALDRHSKTKQPEIVSVSEAAKLLETAEDRLVPVIALGLFAGIRPAEVRRLSWQNILWHKRQIDVPAKIAKTAQARWVDMTDNLIEWLSPYRKSLGPIIDLSESHATRAIAKAGKDAGIAKWPKDGLRHSFGSYHLAAHDNAALTARQMGHVSTDMVYAHYNNRRTREEGIAFFNIRPAGAAAQNIVAIA